VHKPDQSTSVLKRPHPRRRLNLLTSLSLFGPFSLVLLCFFFLFFSVCFVYSIFLFLSFPRLFPAAYLCTSPGRKKKSPECQPMAQRDSKYKESKLGPPAPVPISMESMPVLPLEESCPNTLTLKYLIKRVTDPVVVSAHTT
jgi:hypothetical protein